jgi:hypothetical protein
VLGCSAKGLKVQNLDQKSATRTRLGIVNSTFDPPMSTAAQIGVLFPDCGAPVAGIVMCDPRAKCTRRGTGGVECSCEANGLLEAAGQLTPGRHCTPCSVGSISGFFNVSSQRCELCLPGFSQSPNGSLCRPCDAGYYQPEAGAANCLSCRVFQDGDAYQPRSGATMCMMCPDGTRHHVSSSNWALAESCV